MSERAAALIAAAGVVLLPAEGLYGLHAGQGSQAGIARLRALKRDERARPYILLVADLAAAQRLMDPEAPAAQVALRWMERAWPGPATFVVPAGPVVAADLAREGLVALRCPGSELLRAVAARLPAAVLSTSANVSGAAAPAQVRRIEPALLEGSDLVVDGGALSGQGSTVARVERDGGLTILRPGAWSPPRT